MTSIIHIKYIIYIYHDISQHRAVRGAIHLPGWDHIHIRATQEKTHESDKRYKSDSKLPFLLPKDFILPNRTSLPPYLLYRSCHRFFPFVSLMIQIELQSVCARRRDDEAVLYLQLSNIFPVSSSGYAPTQITPYTVQHQHT